MVRSLLYAIVLISFFACQNDAPSSGSDTANTTPDTLPVYTPPTTEGAATYNITEGIVYWGAKKAIGEPHFGTVNVREGALLVKGAQLIGGEATLEMSTITVSDLKDRADKATLEQHLKDTDFFDVSKFPTASFKIVEVLPSNNPNFNGVLTGELTIKGKTNPVNIPANITIKGDLLEASTVTFPINRTDWGINFRSGMLGTVKEKLIDDTVTLSVQIKAKKG
jgi:polyisoprenoid-binding protein YceI